MKLNLDRRCNQRSSRFFVLEGQPSDLVNSSGVLVHTFAGEIQRVIDLPDGGTAILVYNGSNDGRNVYAVNADGSLRWRIEAKKVRRTVPLLSKSGLESEPLPFSSLNFEFGEGETRRNSLEYFEGSYLAVKSAWRDLFRVDMQTGEITFVRNTGSHDHL